MNLGSKEFFINMKPSDIPTWDYMYSYDEQDDDVKQFWANETKKLMEGVTINGVFIHPWLYWHLNFWNMMLDVGTDRVPGLSQLRDNEWLFAELLKQAEEENKGIFMFGTRRFGKALLNSEILYMKDREKTIGDIVVGDYIYDNEGKLVEVDGVYPQGKVQTYRVTFEDGRDSICCGEHIWRVKIGNKWIDRNLKGIMLGNYTDMYIPITEAVQYPAARLPIPANAYGSMLAAYLAGNLREIPFEKPFCKKFTRSSIEQKKDFIDSFIKASKSVVTGEEVIPIHYKDLEVIRFVQRMFWSYGWYCSYKDGNLIISSNKKELKIDSIEVYGRYPATCITVNNKSHLFLTTNYIVTHNTAIMSSYLARNATMTYNLTHNVIGSSKEDLASLAEYLEFGLDHIHPFLKINRTGNDWGKEVILGTKTIGNERDVHARVRIMNVDAGKAAAALKTAGGTPYTSIYDEVGKYSFLGPYQAGKPAHMMNGRMRGMIIAAGCCCAGTVVYKANGEPCKIEDLKQEDGIIGYDIKTNTISREDITWMKPPALKPCYRITTNKGRILECSDDHPILTVINKRDGDFRYYGCDFRRTDKLRKGKRICLPGSIDIWGDKKMFDPYLVGLLIGNGTYGINKTPLISDSDDEVFDYISSKYDYEIERSYLTKKNKNYKEVRIKNICHHLRDLGIYGEVSKNKGLPKNIDSYDRDDVLMMLRGYFDADSYCVCKNNTPDRICIHSCSELLIKEVDRVLNKLGIFCSIRKVENTNPQDRNIKHDGFLLSISDRDSLLLFCNSVGSNIKYKKDILYNIRKRVSGRSFSRIKSKYLNNISIEVIKDIEYIGEKMVYNLTASNTHTYIANGIITHNTGGNVERSQDAQKVMNDPATHGFIIMNYDLLDRHTTRPTWRSSAVSACFVPGQMSHAYKKEKTTLDKYLGKNNAPGLKKIDIMVTDFDKNTEIMQSKLDELAKGDRQLFVQEKMAFPLSKDDCFLNSNVNRFPIDDAQILLNRLLETGRPGKKVEIFQLDGKRMGYKFSDKEIAPFPFKGGNIDSPVIIYEDPPEEGGNFDYVYTSGCITPGGKVLTDKGLKNVEDVVLSDKLINKDGNYVDIIKCLSYDKQDCDIYTLKMGNTLRKTSFTEEHPIYVSKQVKVNSRIRESSFNFDFKEVKDVKVGDWTKVPNIYKNEWDEKYHMSQFESSTDFWWLVGFWLGNGWIEKSNRVFLCINEEDTDAIARVKDISSRILGSDYGYRERKGCAHIGIKNESLTSWLVSNFGIYSYGKNIPEWVKHLKKDFKLSLIHGYLDSDGCISKHTKGYDSMEFVSVNINMLESFHDMLLSIGIVGNMSILRKKRKGFVVDRISDQREIYHLRIGNYGCMLFKNMINNIYNKPSKKVDSINGNIKMSVRHKNNCFLSDDLEYIYFRVSGIEKDKYTGKVYNFHCDTNNYVCYHITTHNCDPYKQDKANTSSLGAFYILKRMVHINDPFAYKIVASYVSRPGISDDFCRTCEILIEAYGAKCLMENADIMFETYLSRRNKQYILLENGEQLVNKMLNPKSRQNNKLGLSPTVPNQRLLYNTVIQYCWEELVVGYDDDGNEITQKGIYRIPDIELLQEIIAFGEGVNTDRIIAFGHALLLAKYYDDMNYMPKSPTQKLNEGKRNMMKRRQIKGFVVQRHNPFKIRGFR